MKKILSIVLTLALVLGMFVGVELPVFAATSGTTGDCAWTLDGTKLTISGNGKMGDYTYDAPWGQNITEVVIENGVTNIGYYAFSFCTGLTSITIPDSVTSIGSCAFEDCTGLTSITIPDSVTSIGYGAFGGCTGLTSIIIPDSVTSIGGSAFEDCTGLTSITIPDSVTNIGYYAFYGCTGLTSITIPNSVTSIGGSAFYNTAYYNDDANWENGVLYIGNHLIDAKDSISGEYTIKAGTIALAGYAFSGCTGLTSITIPNSVTSIGSSAFSGCTGLASITIPDSVTWIGSGTFYGCTGLTSITIPNSVTSISNYAFYNCTGLTSITIPDSVTSIGNYAFEDCTGLTSITIPNSVTSISNYAFDDCTGLTDVWYTGSEADKAEITIGSYNGALLNATWHYYCNGLIVGEHIGIVDGKIKIPAESGYFTDKNGKLCFPGEYVEAEAGDVFAPAPIEVAADNAFSIRKDYPGIRARGALSKETVEAASEIGFAIVPRIAPDLSADWFVSSKYTYKQPINKNTVYGAADEVDGYQYQLCLWDLRGVETQDFLFAMYAVVDGVTTYTYIGCVSYELVNNALSK